MRAATSSSRIAASELPRAVNAALEGKRFVSVSLSQQLVATSNAGASVSRQQIENNPYTRFGRSALFSEFLASIIKATSADFGNVQLFDSTNRVLRIVAYHGFGSEFVDYFKTVSDSKECVCGVAMSGRTRIVVTDVATDPVFSDESRGVLLRAKVRSVQSTPVDRSIRQIRWDGIHAFHPAGKPYARFVGVRR